MSKRVEDSPTCNVSSLNNFPKEIINLIGTFPGSGSTRRKLSMVSRYTRGAMKNTTEEEKIEELKQTLLEYYDTKSFTITTNYPLSTFYTTVHGTPLGIQFFLYPRFNLMRFTVLTGKPVLNQNNFGQYNNDFLTLRSINHLPKIVRTTMAFVFHTAYGSVEALQFRLKINFAVYQKHTLADATFVWGSCKTFLQNNFYYFLLDSLVGKYRNLKYLNNPPIHIKNEPNIDCDKFYTDRIEYFKEKNIVWQDLSLELPKGGKYFYLRFPKTRKNTKVEFFVNEDESFSFSIDYQLSDESELMQKWDRVTLTRGFLKTIHLLLTECIRGLKINTTPFITVCIQLKHFCEYLNQPYFFVLEGDSYRCEETYEEMYPFIEEWLQQSFQIFNANLPSLLFVHENLNVEIKEEDEQGVINNR